MRKLPAVLLSLMGIFAASAAGAQGVDHGIARYLIQEPAREHYLPQGLSEVSGLAVASNDSVFAHNDEYGIVYEVELKTGKTIKAFALGTKTAKDDFEDIATNGEFIYLLTSDGRIYEARKGEHRKRVLYNVYDTGIGRYCETEGLANGPVSEDFLIVCKRMRDESLKDRLVVFRWNVRERRPATVPWLNVSLDGLVGKLEQANFHPSAFAWKQDTGTLLIISAKGYNAIEVDTQGRLVSRYKLDKQRHPQTEGMTLMPDGRLIIGDEGTRGHGKLTIYSVPR
jgi:hypothetical protein